ncbi:MAG: ATP-dependent DNA helicase RecQ [Chitinophagaceae bacterium]|nr:ATP-dependent DNA helicase RecQ [Chitinophagaceae bacterium]
MIINKSHIQAVLKQHWGYDKFRPLQEDIILSVLEGKDTLALMPTGGGKSLCYQVPAMAQPGLCLVISPLIALMKDQVENLRRKGITAYAIFSGMSRKETEQVLRTAGESNCKFLYVSPERLETRLFKEYLPGLPISLIAVDEAHCISQWGYDFRPPYLRITQLREELPEVPVLALTASATEEVQKDICQYLGFQKETIFRQSFERPNLSYSLFKVEARMPKLREILEKVPGTGIVYCRSRKATQEISEQLKQWGISSDHYHAGLSGEERGRKQEAWIRNEIRVMACTNAFGMGIDKPDVRVVVHTDIPECLENYYQEAGRAGRDGKKAYAVLLYDDQSIKALDEQADLRYPSFDEIRKVYESVGNYFQMPSGAGEGQTFDFDLNDLVKKFDLHARKVMPALGVLEQDDWLSFNEQVFKPSTIQFICSKESIYQFEDDHPELEPLVKTLLRSYEGIWSYPVNISEFLLVKLLKQDVKEIIRDLASLHRNGIIVYTPQKDKPQIQFLRNRVRTDLLQLDTERYRKQEKRFRDRIAEMKRFATTGECRSRFIGEYFGDKAMNDCGICDNCLKKKVKPLSASDIQIFFDRLKMVLHNGGIEAKDLQNKFRDLKKERYWEIMKFLQAEGRVVIDGNGIVSLGLRN